MTSKIKVNILADGGDNAIITSDGAGSFTASSGLASSVQSVGGIQSTPFFEAYRSADVSVGSGSTVKVTCDVEKFDSNGYYDNSTNYRFTPLVAGKYFCYGSIGYNVNNAILRVTAELRKNGTATHACSTLTSSSGAGYEDVTALTSGIVEFNGSTDYLEFYTFHNSGLSRSYRGSYSRTFFGAYRIIGS